MRTVTSLLSFALLCLFFVPSPAAARKVDQAYLNLTGTYETREELRVACIDAVGASQEVNRKNAHITANDRTETYFINRCIHNYNKRVSNQAKGQRNRERLARRTSRLNSRAKEDIAKQAYRVLRSGNNSLRTRARQQVRSRRSARNAVEAARFLQRRQVRVQERVASRKRATQRNARHEANTFCRRTRGQARVTCRTQKEAELLKEWEEMQE